jgi:hypothetical protein
MRVPWGVESDASGGGRALSMTTEGGRIGTESLRPSAYPRIEKRIDAMNASDRELAVFNLRAGAAKMKNEYWSGRYTDRPVPSTPVLPFWSARQLPSRDTSRSHAVSGYVGFRAGGADHVYVDPLRDSVPIPAEEKTRIRGANKRGVTGYRGYVPVGMQLEELVHNVGSETHETTLAERKAEVAAPHVPPRSAENDPITDRKRRYYLPSVSKPVMAAGPNSKPPQPRPPLKLPRGYRGRRFVGGRTLGGVGAIQAQVSALHDETYTAPIAYARSMRRPGWIRTTNPDHAGHMTQLHQPCDTARLR